MRLVALLGLLTLAAVAPAGARAASAAPLAISLEGAHADRGKAFALRGDRVRVVGTLAQWVPGQKAIVRVHRGRKKLLARQVHIRQRGSRGAFRLTVRVPSGRLRFSASHRATPQLGTLRARPRTLTVVTARLSSGARGPLVRLLQRRLARMGYAVPSSGVYDGGTGRAVMAWRKVNGWARSFRADEALVRRVLARRGAYRVRHPGAGRHVEADLSRQVMALVDGRRLHRVYHVSSGAPATPTVVGTFRVYMKTPGTNSLGMVHSTYFHGGYAIHGFASVPAHNASHGCLRVPVPNARYIYDWLRIGNRVIVDR